MSAHARTFDYIVVGAGSAGAIVASRLTENPAVHVLLLEAGREDRNIWSKIPLGFAKIIFNKKYMWWDQETQPEPELNDRRYALPAGKLLGGSSAINGLVHVRGNPGDYDGWEAQGATGWGYDDVLPYFKRYENRPNGDSDVRGTDGPIGIEPARWQNPLADAFIDTTVNTLGLHKNADFNDGDTEGTGYWDLITRNGVRQSTSQTFLKAARKRRNLHIVTEAAVTKVDFEGKRAVGVTYRQGEQVLQARANEVILSAGALRTPQLLQLSGIGPAKLLAERGINVVHALEGVGENLMDHVQVGRKFTTSSPYTFNAMLGTPLAQASQGLQYLAGRRNGPLTIGASLGGAYIKTRPELTEPDLHLHLIPFMPGDKGWDLADFSGFRLGMYQGRPKSRGHLRVTSADPAASPEIVFNHLSHEDDRQTVLAGMKIAKRIAEAMPREFDVREIEPGPAADSDEGLMDYIRSAADTSFHYAGTARMGTDEGAVVDPQLRVRGVEDLRVIDASVMPTETTGNINAAVLMIGEKGADLVKAG